MLLSAPIYRLKRRARLLSREANIPHTEALDRVAREEGFRSWGLLAARVAQQGPAEHLLARLEPGELVLLAGRPGQGKTMLGLELLTKAAKSGRRAVFFTLEYSEAEVRKHLDGLGTEPARIVIDTSDAIDADYIAAALENAPHGSLAVIDYLQLLDQRRETPPLAEQVARLRAFAAEAGLTIVFLSQVDRAFDGAEKPLPGLADLRQPNPLDLGHFAKACFLNEGQLRLETLTPG